MRYTKETTIYNQNALSDDITDAGKTATNYMEHTTTDGLVVGNMTDSTLGSNVQITADPAVNLRNGDTVLASFTPSSIELGASMNDSSVEMLDGGFAFTGAKYDSSKKQNLFIDAKRDDYDSTIYIRAWDIDTKAVLDKRKHTDLVLSGTSAAIEQTPGTNGNAVNSYPLIRESVEYFGNTSQNSFSNVHAYKMGGMCFVSGIVHPNSATTGRFTFSLDNGTRPLDANTPFPIACYIGNAAEGWVERTDNQTDQYYDCAKIYFNFPSVQDWRFNFAFALA